MALEAESLSTDDTEILFVQVISLQMNLTLTLIHGEIIYMDYLKSFAMKSGLCPSNKECGSSEVMAGRLMFSQDQASFGVGLFSRLVL